MRKNILLLSAVFFLCVSSTAIGFYGNMLMYPGFNEYRPRKPFSNEQWEIEKYQREVENYISKGEEFVRNAENDIRTIQNVIGSTISDVNLVVEEYNRFVRSGY